MKVLLVETNASAFGSMKRYADLIEKAFRDDPEVQIARFNATRQERSNRFSSRLGSLYHHFSVWRCSRDMAKRTDADVVHVVDGSHGYLSSVFCDHRCLVTVHDFIPKLQASGQFPTPRPSFFSRLVINASVRGVRSADHRIVDSQHTWRDAKSLGVHGACSLVYPPLDPVTTSVGVAESAPSSTSHETSERPYILHVGNNGFYKHRTGVIEIFRALASQVPHDLVLAGPSPSLDVMNAVAASNFSERVRFCENPSDADVASLYRSASLFVFPSLYEGFGWPPLEAMAAGCPVVCSNRASLPEVVGDAALTADPGQPESFADECVRVLCEPEVRSELMIKGKQNVERFGMRNFHQQLRELYLSLRTPGRIGEPRGAVSGLPV